MSFRKKNKDKDKDSGSKKKGFSLFRKKNKGSKKEKRSIHQLCMESDFEELRKLLKDVSVDINEQDAQGRSPLHLCTDPSCTSLLLALSADVSLKDEEHKRTALHTFCALPANLQDVGVAFLNDCQQDYDIDEFDGSQNTALHLACINGQIKTVNGLIAHGADCNIFNGDGNSVLHAVLKAIETKTCDRQTGLAITNVICSADPTSLFTKNTKDDYPINMAYKMKDDNMLKLLSTEMQKASSQDGSPGPLLENLSTELAYMLSESLSEGRMEVAETLIQAQISFCVEVENIGTTALHYACQNSMEDVALTMLKQPEALNVSSISKKDSTGNTALHYAAEANSFNLVAELLNMDCPGYAKNQVGLTALHVAVVNEAAETVETILELNRFEVIKTGTKKNLHAKKTKGLIDSQDKKEKKTALHYAMETANQDIVMSLLWHNANPLVADKAGNLPFELSPSTEFAEQMTNFAHELTEMDFIHEDYMVIDDSPWPESEDEDEDDEDEDAVEMDEENDEPEVQVHEMDDSSEPQGDGGEGASNG